MEKKICIVNDCEKSQHSKQLCSMHYSRLQRYGDLSYGLESPEQRFWKRVNKTDTCWLWTGTKRSNGYGIMRVHNTNKLVHRYSFFLANGYYPENFVLHSCNVKSCVNPNHLREGTPKDNYEDMVKSGQARFGSQIYNARLTEEQVREMKLLFPTESSNVKLARQFNVSSRTVQGIRKGKGWTHIEI